MESPTGYTPDAFDALLTVETPAVVETPVETPAEAVAESETPEAETPAAARDEKGRFTAKSEEKPAEPAAREEEPKKTKPRDDPQARIDQVIARQREAERRAEAAEARARELEAKVTAPKPVEPAKAETFPNYTTYLQTKPDATLEEWLDARDEWRDTKRDQTMRAKAAEAQRITTFTKQFETFSERMIAAGANSEEFTSKVDPRLLAARPLSALSPQERQSSTFGNFLAELVLKSEHPKDVLLHLSDPTVAQRLATLPPDDVIRDLARFEARLDAAPDSGPASPAKPVVSQAKRPIKPLEPSPPAPESNDNPDDVDEFIRVNNARDRAARKGR